MIYVAFIRKLNFEFKKKWMLRISAFAAALVMGIYVGIAAEDTVMESWEQKGTYRNGYILNFVLSIRDSFVAEPDGYSKMWWKRSPKNIRHWRIKTRKMTRPLLSL